MKISKPIRTVGGSGAVWYLRDESFPKPKEPGPGIFQTLLTNIRRILKERR